MSGIRITEFTDRTETPGGEWHALDEPHALNSDARNRSVDTPWWHRLCRHEWFDKQFIRTIMKPLSR